MLIPNKHCGFMADGTRRAHISSGGGGGGSSGTQRVEQTNVPDWARPQFEEMLGRGIALSQAEYQPFTGQRQAGFNPMQDQAFEQARTQGVAPQLGAASGIAGIAAQQGLQAGQFQPGTFTPMTAQAPQLSMFQMGGPERVGSQSFTRPGTAEQFMNPFMQNVVGIQQREAQRQADIAGTQRGAQAVRAGAFGGSRQAIMDAEAQRNLAQQMGDIQATGSQAAFQQAQQQFNQEQEARMRAAMANQQAGLTAGGQNLQAALGVQQLGAQTGMQAQLANQQALMDAQRAFEQSRQFGADVGLRGGAQALQGAGILGQLGQQQFGQQMDITGLQRDIGREQQMQEQRRLEQQFADFQQQRDFPYQQIGFLSDLLRGAGSSTRTIYQTPQPNQFAQALGAGITGYGLMRAEGGDIPEPKRFAVGGGITGLLPDEQLQERMDSPTVATIAKMAAEKEMMDRERFRTGAGAMQGGLPQMPTQTVAEEMLAQMGIGGLEVSDDVMPDSAMAGGGIVAFDRGGMILLPAGTSFEELELTRLANPDQIVQIADAPAAPTMPQPGLPSALPTDTGAAAPTPAPAPAPAPRQAAPAGIASLSPAARMAEVERLAGSDANLRQRAQELGESKIASREEYLRNLQADQAEGAQFWTDMRNKVESRIEGLSKDEYDAETNKYLAIGAALMANKSNNLGTALGEAFGTGLKVKQEAAERIGKKRDELFARQDDLAALERGEKRGDKKELREARMGVNNAKTELAEALYQADKDAFGRKFGLAKDAVDAFAKEENARGIASIYAGGRAGAGGDSKLITAAEAAFQKDPEAAAIRKRLESPLGTVDRAKMNADLARLREIQREKYRQYGVTMETGAAPTSGAASDPLGLRS